MIRCCFVVPLALCLFLPVEAWADRAVMLVTGESCPVERIDNLDVRKVYLGIDVTIDGNHIRPLRLTGDERLDNVFFQSIVAMSRKSYERRVLSLAVKFGTPRPAEYRDLDAVLNTVRLVECGVTYIWDTDVIGQPGIKVLRLLWSDA